VFHEGMGKQLPRRIIAALTLSAFVFILSGLVFILAGCGIATVHESELWTFPDEVKKKISVGDTRREARTLLGKPLIDARSLGLEAYVFTGRNVGIPWAIYPVPLPLPLEKVTTAALVLYDEEDKITDIAADGMTRELSDVDDTGFQFCSFRVSAGGYHFFNNDVACAEPETLIGPRITLDQISNETGQPGTCSVVFLMGECPMEMISIDNHQVADLSPAGHECRLRDPNFSRAKMKEVLPPEVYDRLELMREQREPKFLWTFIRKNISPGTHRLSVRQATHVKERDFEHVFDCVSGDTVYVELDASKVRYSNWWSPWFEVEGDLVIGNTPTSKFTERAEGLSPVLWHKGSWYGPPQGGMYE